jgi:hypothetical protein
MCDMDRTNPLRYDLGYPCQNPWCHAAVHVSPTCPYPRPEPPRPPTSSGVHGAQYVVQRQREGRIPHVEPLDMRWLWLVPPAVVILGLIMLL